MSDFATRLREAIGNRSVNGFARDSGVSQPLLRKYLDEGSLPRVDKLVLIARAANVSLYWLAAGEGAMRPYAPSAHGTTVPIPVEDLPRESFKTFLDEWWRDASLEQRVWFKVEMETRFPGYLDWKKKTERTSNGQCGA